jgi:hypothetical protein
MSQNLLLAERCELCRHWTGNKSWGVCKLKRPTEEDRRMFTEAANNARMERSWAGHCAKWQNKTETYV